LTDLEGPGNIKMQYDFRQVYASVLGQWFGADEAQITPKALPRHFDQLPIFELEKSSVSFLDDAGRLELGQNYPNPARSSTIIPLNGILDGAGATLDVYSADGRRVV